MHARRSEGAVIRQGQLIAVVGTFQEVRRHLEFETQRQWSEMAIRRTTAAQLGLFSVITLFAARQKREAVGVFRRPGTTRGIRPSSTLWRWCAKSCGRMRLFAGR